MTPYGHSYWSSLRLSNSTGAAAHRLPLVSKSSGLSIRRFCAPSGVSCTSLWSCGNMYSRTSDAATLRLAIEQRGFFTEFCDQQLSCVCVLGFNF
eukprot:m.130250 g.130250  ORF g.130250 m.130250 type:complete len:95 (-) comp9780_c0_seq2:345-629(-)